MKKVLIIFFFFPLLSFSQEINWPIDKETNKITFTEIVNVDSATKNDLYLRAREWFAKIYNDSKEVMQVDDKEAGKIYGKAATSVNVTQMGTSYDFGSVHYDITVIVKDGRYKYTLTNFYHIGNIAAKGTSSGASGGSLENEKPECGWTMNNKSWNVIKHQGYDNALLISASLKEYMSKTISVFKETW